MKIFVCSTCLIAMAGVQGLAPLSELVGTATSGAILIWYLWFTETKSKPRASQELARARKEFLEALAAERSARVEQIEHLTKLQELKKDDP